MTNENNYPFLLCEKEILLLIRDEPTAYEIQAQYLDAAFNTFYKVLTPIIMAAKLKEPHFLRIKLEVHAQKKED